MSVLKKTIKKKSLYREYVNLLNGLLQLSERELQLLSMFVKIDTEWTPKADKDTKDILSTDNRKLIMKETLINKNNLSKYIKKLRDKGLIIPTDDGGYEVIALLRPDIKDNNVNLSFIIEINND